MTSTVTKKYKVKYRIWQILSYLLVAGPMLFYIAYAFYIGETNEKVTLGIAAVAALFLTTISIVFKYQIRSTIFILILVIYFTINNISPLIITLSICTIIDEFIATPLKKMYKQKLVISKEIDKRG